MVPSLTQFDDDVRWLEIRDLLFGGNFVEQDVARALSLAGACKHTTARWLTDAFACKNARTREDATAVLVSLSSTRNRDALCFASVMQRDDAGVRQAALLGCAFAQAWLAREAFGEERFALAQSAALQGERDAFFWLGMCFRHGEGCEVDAEKSKKNFLIAAKLNHVDSMVYYDDMLDEWDPECWIWLCCAAERGNFGPFVNFFQSEVNRLDTSPRPRAVFAIGRCLSKNVDFEKKEIFRISHNFDNLIGSANRAIDFFTAQCDAARRAVDAWCLMAV